MTEPTQTARDVVDQYINLVWNKRDWDLAARLLAETVIRHDIGEAHALTRTQLRKSIKDLWANFDSLRYDMHLLVPGDDGEHVATIYDGTFTKGTEEAHIGGAEVYRVVDGEITEIWSCGDRQGHWL